MEPVKIKLPAGKLAAHYGAATLVADEHNIVEVPPYVARALVAAGAKVEGDPADLSKPVLEMLKAADPSELSYLIHAYGQRPGIDPYALKPEPVEELPATYDGEGAQPAPVPALVHPGVKFDPAYDARSHALAAFAAKGEPPVRIL